MALVLSLGVAAAGQQDSGSLPDLGVAYISLSPRYPAYSVVDAGGFPAAADPRSGRPLAPEEVEKIQRWPRSGETVMATGRVINYGSAPSGPFRYTWSLNGKVLTQGRHPGLAPRSQVTGPAREWKLSGLTLQQVELPAGCFVDLPQPLQWKSRPQRLRLEVRLEGAGREQEAPVDPDAPPRLPNNVREERTDSLAFLVTVPRSAYNGWIRLPQPRRHPSFEDWVQNQFEVLRTRFLISAYPRAPEGVEQPIRLGAIRVVEDGQDLASLPSAAGPDGWDGVWSYDAGRRPPEDAAQPTDLADPAFTRSLLAQLGLVDLAALDTEPDRVKPGPEGKPVLAGYVHPTVPETASLPLPEHSVLALKRMLGKRRGFRGTYLLDVPRDCRLRVLDNNGRVLADAAVSVFQRRGGEITGEPLVTGTTNAAGEFPLPNQPVPPLTTADGFTLRENPFGALSTSGENGLLLVRVSAQDQVEYHWLPVTAFNVAYWSGQTRQPSFDIRTRIPGVRAPRPPLDVKVAPESQGGQAGAGLQWRPPEGEPAGYVVYRAVYPSYAWEKISALTFLQTRYFDPFVSRKPVRYAVTTVSLDGDESRLVETLLAPNSRPEP